MPEAKAEIEITPEMLDAGIAAFAAWQDSAQWSQKDLIASIFRAMLSAKFEQDRKQASSSNCIADFSRD